MEFLLSILFFAALCIGTRNAEETVGGLKISDLSQCPIQVEPVGCFDDKHEDRGLPEQLMNSRDEQSSTFTNPSLNSHWRSFFPFLSNLICECAKRVVEENRGEYLGIQFFAECWSGRRDIEQQNRSRYDKHGESTLCRSTTFQRITPTRTPCEPYCGEISTNYVYRVKPYAKKACPQYFQPVGCFRDSQREPRPLAGYVLNERDLNHPKWNGKIIDWNNWDDYMPEMICRCATKAKEQGCRFFGIQFYGECWAGNNETDISRDGMAGGEDCIRKPGSSPFGETCPTSSDDAKTLGCQPSLCVGKQFTNRVYELKQGPLSCLNNPCPVDQVCETIDSEHFKCRNL